MGVNVAMMPAMIVESLVKSLLREAYLGLDNPIGSAFNRHLRTIGWLNYEHNAVPDSESVDSTIGSYKSLIFTTIPLLLWLYIMICEDNDFKDQTSSNYGTEILKKSAKKASQRSETKLSKGRHSELPLVASRNPNFTPVLISLKIMRNPKKKAKDIRMQLHLEMLQKFTSRSFRSVL
nr:hypothetical protein Iba_chr13bCG15020 [Ipomoea batatas]